MVYTYVLRSKKDRRFYTGSTVDLQKRFKLHNSNNILFTKGRGPFSLVYYEACIDDHDARMREMYLKSGRGKNYLRRRLKRFLSRFETNGDASVSSKSSNSAINNGPVRRTKRFERDLTRTG